jgi:replication factor C subunit 3/5
VFLTHAHLSRAYATI